MRIRPWLAVAAAYAVALQMALTAALAGQLAASITAGTDALVICYGARDIAGDTDGSGKSRIHDAACVLCTLAATSSPGILPDEVVHVPDVESHAAYLTARYRVLHLTQPRTPRLSQGPPRIA